jgi:hypothetical protein
MGELPFVNGFILDQSQSDTTESEVLSAVTATSQASFISAYPVTHPGVSVSILHESILSESSQDDGQESNLYFSDGHYFQS